MWCQHNSSERDSIRGRRKWAVTKWSGRGCSLFWKVYPIWKESRLRKPGEKDKKLDDKEEDEILSK